MKLLIHSNAPWSPSGYGQQLALFLPRIRPLVEELSVTAFTGLSHAPLRFGDVQVFPGTGSGWGDDVARAHAARAFGDPRGGVVMPLVDVFVLNPAVWGELNTAAWTPVDHDPAPPLVEGFFEQSGAIPVAMSRFGQDRLSRFDPLYVPHGVATDVYRPMPSAPAREALGIDPGAFVVGIVAVNRGTPSRKALPQLIEAFAELHRRHEDAVLYLHTDLEGKLNGVHVPSLQEGLGLDPAAIRVVDQYRYELDPLSPEEMASVYSSFDVLLNASMGEGFGLTVLEAQACGVPAIVTDFSAMSEVCGAGWRVGYERWWTDQGSWQARPRTAEVIDALEECHSLPDAARRQLAEDARAHALAYDADRVTSEHWAPALAEIERRFPAAGLLPGAG